MCEKRVMPWPEGSMRLSGGGEAQGRMERRAGMVRDEMRADERVRAWSGYGRELIEGDERRGAHLWGEREGIAREGKDRGEMMGWRGEKLREERWGRGDEGRMSR